jgi:hypothetical protein
VGVSVDSVSNVRLERQVVRLRAAVDDGDRDRATPDLLDVFFAAIDVPAGLERSSPKTVTGRYAGRGINPSPSA